MENRRDERISKLIQALRRTDKIHLKEAARLLGVSEMTIRRDLSEAHHGVVLLGGYIVSHLRHSPHHYFVSDQQSQNVARKRQLATVAARLIEAEDILFFDCGTTMPWIIEAIPDNLPFTAICCAMNTFVALKEKPACRLLLSGGEFSADNAIFMPLGRVSLLETLCPDKAFISAAGIDARQGVTCYNLNELAIKHQALQRAGCNILVADSTKYNKVLPARIGDLSLFDMLISDRPPAAELSRQLIKNQVQLQVAGD
ncbi:DNA-binding transcriptional repressor DeoR [Erwinia sp. OLTSP20]|uniref:DNA-binding transcriptional repressor DeoR n=1 Tax=unclassified Erwinia TaxID=2622719 RepID=UPI000C1A3464|nr:MULTISPECIES: DNA-binding transcriptional repressor DeoR [unclassified Erwinia]PIJ50271.1 DNA-binding transcriptional repressor DeoR [Erwinia sp. OAMSP11]PIJ72109.1 DNA-binding transcriptional repressor DeoR [Erwinia sp. OLSSP12]PIJ81400.1 DNA-binding transcriptional repressor DeoR [Erwinia sp. OLCASP19]PIJ84106.1 DNA-binding transcriptional repressor DeoR [Erwinia sp. OLMTSP26]PIJ85805.1 DNA-binding transcriptional repressor DeoR [Erwinia sp. OLMDSP33]